MVKLAPIGFPVELVNPEAGYALTVDGVIVPVIAMWDRAGRRTSCETAVWAMVCLPSGHNFNLDLRDMVEGRLH
jgi:hypothetical protein